MKLAALSILIAATAVSGCTSMGQVDGTTTVANDETIFMLGVAPENYRVSIFPGSIKGQYFVQSLLRPAAVYGSAKDGFLVGKARAGDVLGIKMVSVHASAGSLIGAQFAPCGDAKTMVFQIPAGKVMYLGHVEYEFAGKTLNIKYSNNMEAAQRYAAEHFPEVKTPVQPLNYQLLESGAVDCPSGATAPAYR